MAMLRKVAVNGEQNIVGGNGYLVASHSQPGYWHTIRGGECDCAGFAYRGHCRHIEAIKAMNAPTAAPASPLTPVDRQNALVYQERQRDPLFLNERPFTPRDPNRPAPTFEQFFGRAS